MGEAKDKKGGVWLVRRPLFLAFICLIVFICIWYHISGENESVSMEKVPVQCMGQVEEIQIKTSGTVLVLSDVQLVNTDSGSQIPSAKLLIYDFTKQNLFSNARPGNIIQISGKYSTFERASNPGGFDEQSYYKSKKMQGKIYADSVIIKDSSYDFVRYGLYVLRQEAMKHLLSVMEEKDAGVLGAMILGEKAYLSTDTKELYQQTGIGHMLAISGLHISLLGAGLFFFLRSYVLPMKKAVIVTVICLLLYGEFTGFPVATARAVMMMCCVLFARYMGRTYDALSALSLSGIVILLQEPMQLFQCGFLLSYTAIAGILLFSRVMEQLNLKNTMLKSLVSGTAVYLVTLPVMLWFFYEVCPYSILANLIVLPLLSLLIGVGIAGCMVSFFWMDGGGFLLATAHYILRFYQAVCEMIGDFPFSRVITGRPSLFIIVIYYSVLTAVVYWYLHRGETFCLYMGAALLAGILYLFPPKTSFLYTQLDVGQGDCACIFYGEWTFLVDGGSSSEKEIGKYTIQKFLKYYGRNRVDAVFISHSDGDHTNGIVELVANQEKWGIRIPKIIMPEIQKRDDGYRALLHTFQQFNTKITGMKKGDSITMDDLSFCCVHPSSDYDWSSENDYSLTLEMTYKNLSILMTGDLEEAGESGLWLNSKKYDILKVGHHGSRTSTSEAFLGRVSPEHAVISVGKQNRYGHPAPVTLERLRNHKVSVWNTAECGAVFVTCSGGKKKIGGYRKTE